MQLYALEGNTCIIAQEALAHKDYRCPECAGIVRARHGPHRRPHFYHMHLSKFCRQRQKSEEHIQTQLFLKKCLPQEEAALEKIYPAIGRIADVAWEREKLVFEIQCSPISAEEVKSRTTDYRSLGFETIWILHDRRFNKRTLCAAEHFLREYPCYFTNIDGEGNGFIYDQFEVCRNVQRLYKGPPLMLALSSFKRISPLQKIEKMPMAISSKLLKHSVFFEGDLICRLSKEKDPSSSIHRMQEIEARFFREKSSNRTSFNILRTCKTFYLTLFRHLLEKFLI